MQPDILDSGYIDRLVNYGIPCRVNLPSLAQQNRVLSSTLRLEVVGQTT